MAFCASFRALQRVVRRAQALAIVGVIQSATISTLDYVVGKHPIATCGRSFAALAVFNPLAPPIGTTTHNQTPRLVLLSQ
jgi:hypothetical protein